MTEVPKRFEHEFKDEAKFLMEHYAAGPQVPQWQRGGRLGYFEYGAMAIHPRPGSDGLPGRNEPCFCGSGLKFKKCCLK